MVSKSSSNWTYNVDEVRVPYKSTERLKSAVKYRDANGDIKVWKPNPKGANRSDIWDFPTLAGKAFAMERTDHPSQKPESLIAEIIKAFCPMKDGKFCGTILDPFHGSGTLGVCCERLNLLGHLIKWTGIEIEKMVRYCTQSISKFMKGRDYIQLQNQGNIISNIRLLYEMMNSDGYADENGYFTKKMSPTSLAMRSFLRQVPRSVKKLRLLYMEMVMNHEILRCKMPKHECNYCECLALFLLIMVLKFTL